MFKINKVLKDTFIDIVQNPLELLPPLLLPDLLLDSVVPEGVLVRDLVSQHQLAQHCSYSSFLFVRLT